MDIKVKKVKEKLQDIAKKTAKEVGHELGEIPKSAPGQLLGVDGDMKDKVDKSGESPIVEAMRQTSDAQDNVASKEEKRKFIKDKSRVDEDIEYYRRKREELEKHWEESQKEMETDDVSAEPGQPLEIPSSKPSRCRYHPGKQKSAEKQLGKK
ncbi:hypothetical protein JXA63_01310 [Candidatus Woesebacteria bacterium]|nr:hypothetical protein [Candidatus Woesebacteria bacterium]